MKVKSLVKLDCEMHSCLRDTIRVSRWMGMFPVQGLDKTDTANVRFNIKSFYTLYYKITIVLQTAMTGLSAHWFFSNDLTLDTLSSLVFFVTGLISAILLLKLAWEWPTLILRAANIERRLTAIRVTKTSAVKFNTITYVILISAVIEHLLSWTYRAKNIILCKDVELLPCSRKYFLDNYFCYMFPYIFKFIPINYFTMTISALASAQATFLWNYTDLMTMCFSMYLKSYFQDFNALVNSQREKKLFDWEQLRIYYSNLVALVQAVDSKMSYLILVSILTNLFFICQQLYYTLNFGIISIINCTKLLQGEKRYINNLINLFYYAYSFSFLVIRATTVLFLAANVNTAAMEPKYVLNCVSHKDYNIHVQRFNRQLRYTTTALSGVFFYVTRRMILKVFATIITYELVLLQFNKSVQ